MEKTIKNIIRLIRGEVSTGQLIKRGLTVGNNFNRQGHCIIDPSHCWLIEIGDNVTMATGVYLLAHDASSKNVCGYTKIGKIIIGNNVFLGAYSIILPNVTIGDNSIVACGSIVTRDIPSNVIVAGNPAKIISTIADYKKKMKNKMKQSIIYDDSYLIGRITKGKKEQMKKDLANKIGFIK